MLEQFSKTRPISIDIEKEFSSPLDLDPPIPLHPYPMSKDRHPAHPPSASAPGVSGFQRSLQPPASVRTMGSAAPPPLSPGSSNTVMPSRQLCRGSCLNHLKADGWAGTGCRPPGSEEAALLLRPGHRLSQMDSLSQHPLTGSGSGQAPPAEAGQAPVGLLRKARVLPFPFLRRGERPHLMDMGTQALPYP